MRKNAKRLLNNNGLNLTRLDKVMLIGTVLIVLVGMVLFSVAMGVSKRNQSRLVADALGTLAQNHKSQMESFVDENVETLRLLASFPEVYGMDAEVQEDFLKGRASRAGFSHFFVVDAEGFGYYFDEGVIRDHSGEQFFAWLQEYGEFVTPPFYTEDKAISTLSVPIYDGKRNKVGYLCGALDLFQIRNVFSDNEFILDGEWFLINTEGVYMAHSDMRKVSKQDNLFAEKKSELSLVNQAIAEQRDMEGYITLQGQKWICRVLYMEDYQWVLVVGCREDAVLEDLQRLDGFRMMHALGMVLLFGLLVRLVYCWSKSDKKNYTDILTKCNSRASYERLLEKLEGRLDLRIAIVYMDLNRFKEVNDTFGHEQGDKVLIAFAGSLSDVFKKQGFVARLGGDEFVCVLLDMDGGEIERLMGQVHEKLKARMAGEGLPSFVTTSYGVAYRERGSEVCLSDVAVEADRLMYEYKEANR